MVQHGVLNLQDMIFLEVGEVEVDQQLFPIGTRAIEAGRHRGKEQRQRGFFQQAGDLAEVGHLSGRPVAQLIGARQINVTPGAGLSLIAELVIGLGQQFTGRLIVRLGKHQMVEQFCGPAVLAFIV